MECPRSPILHGLRDRITHRWPLLVAGRVSASRFLELAESFGSPASTSASRALTGSSGATGCSHHPAPAAAHALAGWPNGPTGIFQLPLAQLVDLARSHLARSFTED